MTSFLGKPFDPSDLEDALQYVLNVPIYTARLSKGFPKICFSENSLWHAHHGRDAVPLSQ